MVSVGRVSGTRGSSIVSSAADVLWMSVVHGMRGVGGVCEMCMCSVWCGVGGEGGFGLYQSCRNRGMLDVCLYLGCGGVGGE